MHILIPKTFLTTCYGPGTEGLFSTTHGGCLHMQQHLIYSKLKFKYYLIFTAGSNY